MLLACSLSTSKHAEGGTQQWRGEAVCVFWRMGPKCSPSEEKISKPKCIKVMRGDGHPSAQPPCPRTRRKFPGLQGKERDEQRSQEQWWGGSQKVFCKTQQSPRPGQPSGPATVQRGPLPSVWSAAQDKPSWHTERQGRKALCPIKGHKVAAEPPVSTAETGSLPGLPVGSM